MNHDSHAGENPTSNPGQSPPRGSNTNTRWSVEMFEPVLREARIDYSVIDFARESDVDLPAAAVEFSLPTEIYHNPAGEHSVRVRLVVDDGRLSVVAPAMYLKGAVRRTTEPPPDADGNQQIVRIEDAEEQTTLDLMMDSSEGTWAELRMDSIHTPFTRGDIVALAEMFVRGVDILDAMLDIYGLRQAKQ
jgi:hypothetical protein